MTHLRYARPVSEPASDAGQWNLVIGMSGGGKRNWLRPRWYITYGGCLAAASPWPAEIEWRPVPDPDRFCVRCGADKTEGSIFRDPEGAHCEPCHDLLHPYVPRTTLPAWRRRLRSAWWRVSPPLDLDRLYWAWCERLGKRIVQEDPPRPV